MAAVKEKKDTRTDEEKQAELDEENRLALIAEDENRLERLEKKKAEEEQQRLKVKDTKFLGGLPVIRSGQWCRLSPDKGLGIPDSCRGKDAVVTDAPTITHPGDEQNSSYEYQTKDTIITVRVRENGTVLSLKRNAMTGFADSRAGLTEV